MEPPIVWCCPACRGTLRHEPESCRCEVCSRTYRTLRGIPDLRLFDDEYMSNDDDWRIARALDQQYDERDFRGVLDLYYDLNPEVTRKQRASQIQHILTAPGRVGAWLDALALPPGAPGPLLDLGCGTGSFLAAVGPRGPALTGVDIAMRWLLVARKRLEEEGLTDVPLACAGAEALPLRDGCVQGIVAGDVIEHVRDPRATLDEAQRVLRPEGRLFLASPNRFSLAPEPHVNVWGVGFLPRTWMPAYVRRVRGIDFRAIHTMGLREWRGLLAASAFRGGRLGVPPLPASDLAHFSPLKRTIARAYNAIVTKPLGQRLALRLGPLFHVICEKRAEFSRPLASSPTTRPHSRPSVNQG